MVNHLIFDDNNDKKDILRLDQFYTKKAVSKKCVKHLLKVLPKIGINQIDLLTFLEPSAGNGSFIIALKEFGITNIIAYDIDPTFTGVIKKDFLSFNKLKFNKNQITIGNPPFGKKSRVAISFFNLCASCSNVVAFIVPLQFRKWSVQRNLDTNMMLVSDIILEENSFITPKGKEYNVRCCFQIWSRIGKCKNLRILKPLELSNDDFIIWQYNNTKGALKYFDNDFDFAVPRQGFCDYSRREFIESKCEKTTQWMLFKAKNKDILDRLLKLDFEKLSKNNTTIPGFGKADVIKLYNKLYNKEKKCVMD